MHNRKIEEAMNVAKEFKSLYDIAVLSLSRKLLTFTDYINEYDQDIDVIKNKYQTESDDSWFLASQLSHTPMDYVYMDNRIKAEDLEKYSLLIYSHPVILTENTRDTLTEYVRNGGTLVIGARAGFKDIYGRSPMTPVPDF
jgi:beta-galactosidase